MCQVASFKLIIIIIIIVIFTEFHSKKYIVHDNAVSTGAVCKV